MTTTAMPTHSSPTATFDYTVARQAIDAKTKPLGSLGRLEEIAVRLAILQGTLTPSIRRARVCVFGADHGVSLEGVSAYPRAVTGEMMRNFDRGGAAINVIGASCNVEVEVIDIGVDADLDPLTRIRHEKIRHGSRNMITEAAMTENELDAALAIGAAAAQRAISDGVTALGLGEMGIGNTTTAATLLSALTGHPAEVTVGRGTGVDDETFTKKCAVVETVLRLHTNANSSANARELMRCVGGLELAAIAGAALEASRHGIAVVADGFISTVAILCALHMESSVEKRQGGALSASQRLRDAVFFAHRSAERGHHLALDACTNIIGYDAKPLLDLDMRLGEGSGAALSVPLLRAAAAVMSDMATFASASVSAGAQAEAHDGPRP